jgi:hypothetical protein
LKQNRLVDTMGIGRLLAFTTTLTDVVTDLCSLAASLDGNFRIVTVVPNGPATTSFDLALIGEGFELTCGRRLVRGGFPFNPLAAEFGRNYDVLVTLAASSNRMTTALMTMLESKYSYEMIA